MELQNIRNVKQSTGDDIRKPGYSKWGLITVFGCFILHFFYGWLSISTNNRVVDIASFRLDFNDGIKREWASLSLDVSNLFSGLLSAVLINRFGCRPIIIAGSIIAGTSLLISIFVERFHILLLICTACVGTGVGFGMMLFSAIVSVTMYFDEFRPLAIGMALSGIAIKGLLDPMKYYVPGDVPRTVALITFTVITYSCTFIGVLFKPIPKNLQQSSISDYSQGNLLNNESKILHKWISLLKDPIFIIFVIPIIILPTLINTPIVILVKQFELFNLTHDEVVTLYGMIPISRYIGCITTGLICIIPKINRLSIYCLCIMVCGLVITYFTILPYNYYPYAIYSCTFGFTHGAFIGLTPIILVDLVGVKQFTIAFAIIRLCEGMSLFISAPLIVWIFKMFHKTSNNVEFWVLGILILISGMLLILITIIQRRRRNIPILGNSICDMTYYIEK